MSIETDAGDIVSDLHIQGREGDELYDRIVGLVQDREAPLMAIIRKLAEPGAGVTSDEFHDSRCVFCEAAREFDGPTYEWRDGVQVPLVVPPLEHKEGCVILKAQAIVAGASQ